MNNVAYPETQSHVGVTVNKTRRGEPGSREFYSVSDAHILELTSSENHMETNEFAIHDFKTPDLFSLQHRTLFGLLPPMEFHC